MRPPAVTAACRTPGAEQARLLPQVCAQLFAAWRAAAAAALLLPQNGGAGPRQQRFDGAASAAVVGPRRGGPVAAAACPLAQDERPVSGRGARGALHGCAHAGGASALAGAARHHLAVPCRRVLGHNRLTGPLPPGFLGNANRLLSLSNIAVVDLQANRLTGPLPNLPDT